MSPEHFEVLFYVVVVLFVITFIFALLAMAGKISVDKKIRYGLYTAFVLELGLAFFGFLKLDYKAEYSTNPPQSDWVGLDVNTMKLIRPTLLMNGKEVLKDTKKIVLGKSVSDAKHAIKDKDYTYKVRGSDLQIFNTYDTTFTEPFGRIPDIQSAFFNQLNYERNTLSLDYRKTVEFKNNSATGNRWKKNYSFFEAPGIDVRVIDSIGLGTGYIITQKKVGQRKPVELFNSLKAKETREAALHLDTRIIHTFEHDGVFYIIFIVNCDNIPEGGRFFDFQQLKLVPGLYATE